MNAPRPRVLTPALVSLAFVLGALAGAWGWSRRAAGRASASSVLHGAVTPEQCVPPGVRGVVLADVARLRSSPAVGRFFPATESPDEPCEARLLRGVQRVALAFPGEALDDFAVAFAGELPRERLLECARSRQGGGATTLTTGRYRGIDVLRAEPRREGGLLPAPGAEIVYLPGGTVLAGQPDLVRRMVDHALARDDGSVGAGPREALDELRARLGPGHAIETAFVFPGGARPDADADPAFRHVVGVALGASVESGLNAVAVLACDDFDSPRAVADAVERARTRLRDVLDTPALGRVLQAIAVERRATDVRVSLALNAAETDGLTNAAASLLSLLGREPPTTMPTPGSNRDR